MAKAKFDVGKHLYVPKHSKLSEKDKKELLDKYKISIGLLPLISKKDPAIEHLKPKEEDIVKIERDSPLSGKTVFYRVIKNV
ncbi:DNA-directed RNA polymerase subunit H [Candidatus Woesearchaeota archaeon]|nr:DNA-directed RNA polymerase subunit H [Candidatus Woesearchaeota archaeon]